MRGNSHTITNRAYFFEYIRPFCQYLRLIVVVLSMGISTLVVSSRSFAQDLLETVRAGNKSSLESIRTLYCRVSLTSPLSSQAPSIAEFWRSADSWRVRCTVAGQPSDMVGHDYVTKKLLDGPKGKILAIARSQPDEPNSNFDAYGMGLLKLFGPKGWPLTLEEVLARPHKLMDVSRQPYRGHDCIVVKMSIQTIDKTPADYEVWFDPAVNFLASKLIGETSSAGTKPTKMRRESIVERFVEAAPGVYFPVATETKFYSDGKLFQHDVVAFSEIRVNQSLPSNIFNLPVPPNSTVMDAIQDREYQVDAQGKAIGQEKPLPKVAPLPATLAQVESSSEPTSVGRWIFYGLVVVFAASAGVWYFRRWKAASSM